VLIAGDLVGWDDRFRYGPLSCRTPFKQIRRESPELYTLYYPFVYYKIVVT
jgi:hypothetical protein